MGIRTGLQYLFQGEGTTHGPVRSDGLISPWLRLFMLWASFLFGHCDASLLWAALHIFALIQRRLHLLCPLIQSTSPFTREFVLLVRQLTPDHHINVHTIVLRKCSASLYRFTMPNEVTMK